MMVIILCIEIFVIYTLYTLHLHNATYYYTSAMLEKLIKIKIKKTKPRRLPHVFYYVRLCPKGVYDSETGTSPDAESPDTMKI